MSNTNRRDRNDLLLVTTDSLAGQVLYQTTNWPISQPPCWQADQRIANNITSTIPPFSDYSLLIVPVSPRTHCTCLPLHRCLAANICNFVYIYVVRRDVNCVFRFESSKLFIRSSRRSCRRLWGSHSLLLEHEWLTAADIR